MKSFCEWAGEEKAREFRDIYERAFEDVYKLMRAATRGNSDIPWDLLLGAIRIERQQLEEIWGEYAKAEHPDRTEIYNALKDLGLEWYTWCPMGWIYAMQSQEQEG